MLKPNLMRKALYGLSVIVLLFTLLTACKKDESVTDGTSNPPPPAGPLNLYMTDYYPDSFYHNYATLNVTNDSANIYLKFAGINKFQFKDVRLVAGSLSHLKDVLSPFTTPPLSERGPQPADYIQTYNDHLPDSCLFTISRRTIKEKSIYIYAWAYVERYNENGILMDWHSSWARTNQHINGDAATSYIQYTME